MLRVGAVIIGFVGACVIQQPGGTTPPPAAPPPPESPAPASSSGDPAPAVAAPPPRADDRATAHFDESAMVRVPDVQHESLADAQRALHAAGMTGEVHVQWAEDVPHGNQWLCGTQPSAGQEVRADFDVEIDFCRPDPPAEPKLYGGSLDDAKRAIAELMAKVYPASAYRIEVATDRADASCPAGTVCGVEPRRWYADPVPVITIHVAK